MLISFKDLVVLKDQPVAVLVSGHSLRRQDKRPDQVGARTPLPGTQPAGDDAKTDPYQVSHNAWSTLSVAVDHMHCYRASLMGEQQGTELPLTLHTHAQYSLLRGAFESSARVVWMLAPANRLVRIHRSAAFLSKLASTAIPTACWSC